MRKNKKTYKRLEQIVNKTFSELTDKIIIHTGNIYVLYNQYAISREQNGISVFRRRDDSKYTFDKMKHAVAWVILDHNNRLFEADRVQSLDRILASVEVDKIIHDRLRKIGNIERHIIYTNKLQTDIARQKQFVTEIDKYIITANICHQRGIRNELNRTSRK